MKKILVTYGFLVWSVFSCSQKPDNTESIEAVKHVPEKPLGSQQAPARTVINSAGTTIETRIMTPDGYKRTTVPEGSFAAYLRNLPLKPVGSKVIKYDGSVKEGDHIYLAVVDLPIGGKDLHQCADAVMRLRAEYLYKKGNYDSIHFNLTNGFRVDYVEWMQGKRVAVQGNKTFWVPYKEPSNTYDDFWKYMELIFMYAGTYSLSEELVPVSFEKMEIGDVFIQGGSPGHSVIVVDIAVNPSDGNKIFMLAQSYMPAQEIQVLVNPADSLLSPWYNTGFGSDLITPEWGFYSVQLKRFP